MSTVESRWNATSATTAASADPTSTQTVRHRLGAHLRGRWEDARGDVRRYLTALIRPPESATGRDAANQLVRDGLLTPTAARALRRRDPESPQAQQAFRAWLSGTLTTRILHESTPATRVAQRSAQPAGQSESGRGDTAADTAGIVAGGAGAAGVAGAAWFAALLRTAYQSGLRIALAALRRTGYDVSETAAVAIAATRHQQAIDQQVTRTHHDLEDAIGDTVKEASREYRAAADGGASVENTVEVVNDRLDKVGRYRSELIAESRPVTAANDAAIQAYDRAGVEEVGVAPETTPADEADHDHTAGDTDLEWRTANDRRVCPKCIRLALDGPYKLAAVIAGDAPRPVRDSHPRCRCYLLPLSA